MVSKFSKNVSLSDKISDLLSTKPQDTDDEEDETIAKLTEHIEDEFSETEEKEASIFRKRNAALLEDLDERYAGKKGSRKMLGVDDSSDSNSDDLDSSNLEAKTNSDSDSVSVSGSDEEDEEDDSDGTEEQDVEFQHIDESKTNDSNKNKGHCVRNQLSIWESLLEMRIQFQKCLIAANKMPEKVAFSNLSSGKSDFSKKVSETSKTISGTLNKLLELQDSVISQFPETKYIHKAVSLKRKKSTEQGVDDVDEEIPSDSDAESDKEQQIGTSPAKKQKLDLKVELNKRHEQYRDYRISVIQKWNDKTRLAVSKSSINNHSVINQIEHNLSDKSRLIRKTQLKRSQYSIIGESQQQPDDSNKDEEIPARVSEEYNNNIFDDDDFYHHLLRELIEVKSADLTDPVQLGRQWIQLQNLRSKMKRKIDTKATKGRKIRYAVHSKLVNFMAPIDDCMWTHEAKNELYSSLFGKK